MSNDDTIVWLSMGEAAKQLGTSPKTLKRMIERTGTKVLTLNGNYRIRQSVLDQLIAEQEKPLKRPTT